MIGNAKPNFKLENCGTNETRAKYEAEIKLSVLNLKRGRHKYGSARPYESIGEILARKKWRTAAADHESQV